VQATHCRSVIFQPLFGARQLVGTIQFCVRFRETYQTGPLTFIYMAQTHFSSST